MERLKKLHCSCFHLGYCDQFYFGTLINFFPCECRYNALNSCLVFKGGISRATGQAETLKSVELECPIHGCRSDVGGVCSKPDSGGHGSVVIEDPQVLPLLARVHTNVCAGDSQVTSGIVKAEIAHLVPILQTYGLKVLDLSQIPESHT